MMYNTIITTFAAEIGLYALEIKYYWHYTPGSDSGLDNVMDHNDCFIERMCGIKFKQKVSLLLCY